MPPDATMAALGAALRAGRLTAAELLEQCLAAIAERDAALNAFITVLAADARRQARAADAELAAGSDRGPLHGIPVSLKDLIDVAGVPTTAASHARSGHGATGRRAAHGPPARGRRGPGGQVQPARVRAGHYGRGFGLWSHPQPACAGSCAGRFEQWIGGVGGGRDGGGVHRHGPPAGPFAFRRLRAGW